MQRGSAPPDRGVCLSMHQPWASLLVYGLKRIEGRGWPSDHRGRLWIASTVQQPSPQDIEELEAFYRTLHTADAGAAPGIAAEVQLPPAYPTGVLLGCVEVADVATAEQVEGWHGLPGGLKAEVGSPYCFLCEQPQRLVVPHAVRGQHKIWPLDKQLHKNAQLGLKPAPNGRDFRWSSFGAPPPPGGLPASQNKTKFMEAQRRQSQTAEQGGGKAARTAGSSSPRAASAAAAAAGVPRAVALQQAQQAAAAAGQQQEQDPAKRLRAVQKKLRQIAAIEEKAAAGQALQAEELAKLGQKAVLEAEAAALAAA
ncbi:activating signal cointegrator 1 [Chlorella sorokiniana]|uniref:Activating signal cointegrator 1 n=1 Tax=Chlorella sorokiniana TaxID=3076 RepID=A0A2P6TI60_CHLSO|nr:activating signal cointegrator 1 [Chlorella sorokiniana]|eukprot:PRW33985.1 activating signal cointegrator 1 [Chlorella sorokiniana]